MNTSRIGHSHAYILHSACRMCRTACIWIYVCTYKTTCTHTHSKNSKNTTQTTRKGEPMCGHRSHADEVKLCVCVCVCERSHGHEGTIYTNAKCVGFEFGRWQCVQAREGERERFRTRARWVSTSSSSDDMSHGAQSVYEFVFVTY